MSHCPLGSSRVPAARCGSSRCAIATLGDAELRAHVPREHPPRQASFSTSPRPASSGNPTTSLARPEQHRGSGSVQDIAIPRSVQCRAGLFNAPAEAWISKESRGRQLQKPSKSGHLTPLGAIANLNLTQPLGAFRAAPVGFGNMHQLKVLRTSALLLLPCSFGDRWDEQVFACTGVWGTVALSTNTFSNKSPRIHAAFSPSSLFCCAKNCGPPLREQRHCHVTCVPHTLNS